MKKKPYLEYSIIAIIALLLIVVIYNQFSNPINSGDRSRLTDKIVILYTNDVHCYVDQYIGYAGLAAYKEQEKKQNPNVILVDCGDAIQGEHIGTIAQGEFIVDMMNKVGYDLAILGNHEFDYGMGSLQTVIKRSKAKYLNCNITYSGSHGNALSQMASYTVLTYGKTKLGFVGVTTPGSINTSTPIYFQENNIFVYDFKSHYNGKDLFETVQRSVDDCIKEGANYVILLSHLGVGTGYEPYTSTNLIANTTGIDAVLDGHSHTVIPFMLVKNKIGNNVVLTSTGDRLRNIGKLTISPKGITSELLTNYKNKETNIGEYIASIRSTYKAEMQKVVGTSTTHLSMYDEKYVRLIRNRETNLGDWCTDALLHASKGDIALFNGGSIRSDIKKGTVTLGDLKDVNGFNNMICKISATGQEILDVLEMAYRKTMNVVTVDGKWSVGEFGGFLQVSGLKCTIDTSQPSYVIVDDNGMYEKINGPRRVKDVMVKQGDEYVPIDPQKSYIVVSTEYLIKESGDGINLFCNHKLLEDCSIHVTQAYIDYFRYLNGDFSDYEKPQGRIIVK